MRLVLSLVAVIALAGYRGGCDRTSYDPCADKVCGAPCRACDPDDARCVETAVVKACDPRGACVASVPDQCGTPEPVPGTCDGKACGDECFLEPPCRRAEPPCMAPTIAGACGADGICTTEAPACPPPPPPPPPYDPCAGKACGDACDPCAPGVPCLAIAVVTACDPKGACVPATPTLCYDPCAGKACGDPCTLCPPSSTCVEPMYAKACDAGGTCAPSPVTCR